MQLHDCINFLLTNTQNSVFLFFKKELQDLNVTPIQYALLKCLWDEDFQSPTNLAFALSIDTSSVTGILSRLEEKKYIERKFNTVDRRCVTVCLTPTGKALQKPVEERIRNANNVILADISSDDMEITVQSLQKISETAARLIK